ncbi:hypothetical protein CEP54_008280 [Fusarium duplospermum]|uniref:2EXR domain-containing protein n=1 Tax=Fusarium duplospermum TaxID=1325734 RepID=A0A428PWT5_9HYPO|nr:hypothetical protein CEP54_008280 [Fusarium duplospermum]
MSTSTPQCHNTFHRFIHLPWDIREQIWKFALRPSFPGAHIFKLYEADPHGRHGSRRLAVPDSKENSSIENRDVHVTQNMDNPSTYLTDGGLWTACKESRHVIQRHFGLSKWRSLHDKDTRSFQAIQRLDMPATGYFTGKDPYFFTIFPNRDLFILQPQEISMIEAGDLSWHTRIGAPWQGFDGFKHIALEYNQDWEDMCFDFSRPLNQAYMKAIIALGFHAVGDKLWFIDYTLRRRHEVVAERSNERKCAAFYLQGQRLVEVGCSPNSLKKWMYTERVKGEDVERVVTYELNSMSFVRKVRCLFMDSFEVFDVLGYEPPRQVGLLACEPF